MAFSLASAGVIDNVSLTEAASPALPEPIPLGEITVEVEEVATTIWVTHSGTPVTPVTPRIPPLRVVRDAATMPTETACRATPR